MKRDPSATCPEDTVSRCATGCPEDGTAGGAVEPMAGGVPAGMASGGAKLMEGHTQDHMQGRMPGRTLGRMAGHVAAFTGLSPRLLWRALRMAFFALGAYRLRSLFVVAAVSLGIASLTVIVAAVDGASKKAEEITDMFGPDAVLVFGGSTIHRAVGDRNLTLSWDDALALRSSLPGAYLVVPMRAKSAVRLKNGDANYDVPIVVGATENYAEAWNWPLVEGRDFTAEDVRRGARVCLLGDKPARELFGDVSPVGRSFLMAGVPMTVVGRLAYRGMSGGGGSVDDRLIVPITTLTQRFNLDRRYFRALRVKFTDAENIDRHVADLTSLLRDLHGLKGEDPDDFTVLTASEVRRFLSMIKGGLVLFLGITAAAAMAVGGFVLANLFYLSVTERRVEIGLKKALGAPSRAVLVQFLCEAVALTLLGAIVGLLLGMAMGQALERLGFIEMVLSAKVFGIAVVASSVVGVVFGLRPARAAAALDPIAALRGGE